jgi:hypothetical protein
LLAALGHPQACTAQFIRVQCGGGSGNQPGFFRCGMFAVLPHEFGYCIFADLVDFAIAQGAQIVADGIPARVQIAMFGFQLLDARGGSGYALQQDGKQLFFLVDMVGRAGDVE